MNTFGFSAVWNPNKVRWALFLNMTDKLRPGTPTHNLDIAKLYKLLVLYVNENPQDLAVRHPLRMRVQPVSSVNPLPLVTLNYDPGHGAKVIAKPTYQEILPTIEPHLYMLQGVR